MKLPVPELEARLGRARKPSHRRYIRFNCPFCTDSTQAEAVRSASDQHQCLFVSLMDRGRNGRRPGYGCTRCRARGGRRKLLALLGISGGLPPLTSDLDYDELRSVIWTVGRKDEPIPPPVKYGLPPSSPLPAGSDAMAYVVARGVRPQWAERAGLRLGTGKYYVPDDPTKFVNVRGCIVIPDSPQDTSYWVARQYWPGFKGPKYKNPPGAQAGTLLFLRGAPRHRVVLVEGPFDALIGGPDCAAILGKEMSWSQIGALLQHAPSEVVVALDGEASADQEALAGELTAWGLRVRTTQVPVGEDAASLGRREFRRLINAAAPWQQEEWR